MPLASFRYLLNGCGRVFALLMDGHPLHGLTFGVPGTITPLIDSYLDHGHPPAYMWDVLKGRIA